MKVCLLVANQVYTANTIMWFLGHCTRIQCLNKKRKFASERRKQKVLSFNSLHLSIGRRADECFSAECEKGDFLVEGTVDAGSGNCREVAQFEAEEESSRHLFPFMLMLEIIFSA